MTFLPNEALSCVKTVNHRSQELLLIRTDKSIKEIFNLLVLGAGDFHRLTLVQQNEQASLV